VGLVGVLFLVLGLMALSNEHLVKPGFAVPRPHVQRLADAGVLAMSAEEFYASGNRAARVRYLERKLAAPAAVAHGLSPAVSAHWSTHVGYSFPSGHATAAMTTLTFFLGLGLCLLSGWRWRIFLAWIPWALAVCYTRPILQVHSPLDVTVGGIQGILFGWAGVFLAHRWLQREAARGETFKGGWNSHL
jgi:phosphatidylglycerophosphatase B